MSRLDMLRDSEAELVRDHAEVREDTLKCGCAACVHLLTHYETMLREIRAQIAAIVLTID